MVLKIKSHFVIVVLIIAFVMAGCSEAAQKKQETAIQPVQIEKNQYKIDNSEVFIPQVRGMTDTDLQTRINSNLKTAISSLKNQSPNSSIHGDFEVSFYNGNLLGIHFWGDSFTPGMPHPNKIDCGIHIDLTTGKVYKIEDLFKPDSNFEKRIKEYCSTNDSTCRLNIDGLAEDWRIETFTSSWTDVNLAFLLSTNSMRVYSIPSYAQGAISGYNVPYADLVDIINKDGELWKKLKSQEARTIEVSSSLPQGTQAPVVGTNAKETENKNTGAKYLTFGFDLMRNETLGLLKIGVSADEVVKGVGKPAKKSLAKIWPADGWEHQDWYYPEKGIELNMVRRDGIQVVSMIDVKSPCKFKTKRGIGIGSAAIDVETAYNNEINPQYREIFGVKNLDKLIAGTVYGGVMFSLQDDVVSEIFIGAAAE